MNALHPFELSILHRRAVLCQFMVLCLRQHTFGHRVSIPSMSVEALRSYRMWGVKYDVDGYVFSHLD